MAQPPQRPWLRLIVPLAILLAGIGVFMAVLRNTGSQKGPGAPTQAHSPATSSNTEASRTQGRADAEVGETAGTGGDVAAQPSGTTAPPPPPSATAATPRASDGLLEGLRARDVGGQPGTTAFDNLGSLDAADTTALIEFSPYGAGIRRMTLSRYFETARRKPGQQVVIQEELATEWTGGTPEAPEKERRVFTPFGAVRIEIEGRVVDLAGREKSPGRDVRDVSVWRQTGAGSFECIVENAAGTEILRISRVFELVPGTHVLRLLQRVENQTDRTLRFHWWQFGPTDLRLKANKDPKALAYGGDKRRVRFGYLGSPQIDPTRQNVLTAAYETTERRVVVEADRFALGSTIWPRTRSVRAQHELVWYGLTDRYFTATVFPLIDLSGGGGLNGPDKVFRNAATIYRILLNPAVTDARYAEMVMQSRSDEIVVPGGRTASVDMGVYAGPLLTPELEKLPETRELNLGGLVVYNFGGWCGSCTFGWLTHLLLALLKFLHDWVLFDWALAIIVLVVVVRTMLHPVTRWSQIRMARFGKQIGDLGPKQKKLQERYKDDPKKLREEIGRLYREEGVNPAGMLGCLPALMQTPIWIALYAMLYFAFELRQEAAFFGLFQGVSGKRWWFLGDLAEPDGFIPFGVDIYIPLLSGLLGPVSGLNLLPLILGVVFFVQQKYLTPPTSATLTPEQEQTQKIMKVMMVVMFPLFMYNAPSGLAIYFITNSSLGIAESKWIRSHMTKHDLLNVKKPVKQGGGGFLARLQAAMQERQRQLARRQQGKRKP